TKRAGSLTTARRPQPIYAPVTKAIAQGLATCLPDERVGGRGVRQTTMTNNTIRYIRGILATVAVVAAALAGTIAISSQAHTAQAAGGSNAPVIALPWLKTLNGQVVRADNNQRVELRGANVLRNEWVYPD